jgi:hypothetical protein
MVEARSGGTRLYLAALQNRTGRTYVAVRTAGDVLGGEGASLTDRSRGSGGRVNRGLQLELGVDLGAVQHDVEGDVEPEQENDHRAKRAVKPIVMGEVGDIV